MEATLYLPGQPARPVALTALTCAAAAPLLGLPMHLVEVLAGALPSEWTTDTTLPDGYVVFASGEVSADTPHNDEAADDLAGVIGWCEVYGPALIVKQ